MIARKAQPDLGDKLKHDLVAPRNHCIFIQGRELAKERPHRAWKMVVAQFERDIAAGAKARAASRSIMYGLKPVPFKLSRYPENGRLCRHRGRRVLYNFQKKRRRGFDLIRIAHAISSGRFELPCLP
jgi:hypothetical protein